MTHWRRYVSANNPHLHHWDIEESSPVTVVIEGYEHDSVRNDDGDTEAMLFLSFKNAKKKLGVNVTNARIIEALHGPNIEKWVGQPITLRRATCRGEECIRVDSPQGLKLPKRCPKFKYIDGGRRPESPPDVDIPAANEGGEDLPLDREPGQEG